MGTKRGRIGLIPDTDPLEKDSLHNTTMSLDDYQACLRSLNDTLGAASLPIKHDLIKEMHRCGVKIDAENGCYAPVGSTIGFAHASYLTENLALDELEGSVGVNYGHMKVNADNLENGKYIYGYDTSYTHEFDTQDQKTKGVGVATEHGAYTFGTHPNFRCGPRGMFEGAFTTLPFGHTSAIHDTQNVASFFMYDSLTKKGTGIKGLFNLGDNFVFIDFYEHFDVLPFVCVQIANYLDDNNWYRVESIVSDQDRYRLAIRDQDGNRVNYQAGQFRLYIFGFGVTRPEGNE